MRLHHALLVVISTALAFLSSSPATAVPYNSDPPPTPDQILQIRQAVQASISYACNAQPKLTREFDVRFNYDSQSQVPVIERIIKEEAASCGLKVRPFGWGRSPNHPDNIVIGEIVIDRPKSIDETYSSKSTIVEKSDFAGVHAGMSIASAARTLISRGYRALGQSDRDVYCPSPPPTRAPECAISGYAFERTDGAGLQYRIELYSSGVPESHKQSIKTEALLTGFDAEIHFPQIIPNGGVDIVKSKYPDIEVGSWFVNDPDMLDKIHRVNIRTIYNKASVGRRLDSGFDGLFTAVVGEVMYVFMRYGSLSQSIDSKIQDDWRASHFNTKPQF